MKTIALRFADNFAPPEGTICAHDTLIKRRGFVFYGKKGTRISEKAKSMVLNNDDPRILLIHSGAVERYWAYISDIQYAQPEINTFPSYYAEIASSFKTWFKIIRFEKADKNILSKCVVLSSQQLLSDASKYSMSPYFMIESKP